MGGSVFLLAQYRVYLTLQVLVQMVTAEFLEFIGLLFGGQGSQVLCGTGARAGESKGDRAAVARARHQKQARKGVTSAVKSAQSDNSARMTEPAMRWNQQGLA